MLFSETVPEDEIDDLDKIDESDADVEADSEEESTKKYKRNYIINTLIPYVPSMMVIITQKRTVFHKN